MHLVDDDVVEAVDRQRGEGRRPREALDRGEEHVEGLLRTNAAEEPGKTGVGQAAAQGARGLLQQLPTMRDPEDGGRRAGRRRQRRDVEGREDGLAEAGGHHDEGPSAVLEPARGEGIQRVPLQPCGYGERNRRLFGDLADGEGPGFGADPGGVGVDPVGVDDPRGRPEPVVGGGHPVPGGAVPMAVDA